MSTPPPPHTRSTDDVDELAGVSFPDPYRWLEGDGPEVDRWQDEQGEAAAAYTDKEVALTENTEWLAFAMKVLGLKP